jgi:hypothetical protein
MSTYSPVGTIGKTGDGRPVHRVTWRDLTIEDIHRTPFLFYQDHRNRYNNVAKLALEGLWENSKLSLSFFSKENIKKLQELLRREIYYRTDKKFLIDDQSEDDLIIAMRAVYLQYATNLPYQIAEQTEKLNYMTIDYVAPDMVTGIRQFYGYIRDISTAPRPIDRPLNVSKKGTRTLPSVSTVIF